MGHEISSSYVRGRVNDQGQVSESSADDARRFASCYRQSFRPVDPRRLIQEKKEIDDIRQGTIPLHASSDFIGTSDFAGADGQTREIGFGQTRLDDLTGQ